MDRYNHGNNADKSMTIEIALGFMISSVLGCELNDNVGIWQEQN